MLIADATELPRLMACNGSRLLPASTPVGDSDTTIRDEGNAAHHMALSVFRNEFTIEELIDRKAPNGVYMSPEMADHVGEYLDAIVHIDRGAIDIQMEIPTTFEGNGWRVNGRADGIAYNSGDNALFVDDLKYGYGIVEPERNWTLIAHAIGHCLNRKITPERIVFTIHQPRPYHPDGKRREWVITYPTLTEFYQQIVATLSAPSDLLNTGAQCRKCHALATCPAAREASMNAVDIIEAMAFNDEMPNDALSFELDTLSRAEKMLEQRHKALQELAKHRLKSGQIIENYGLENQLSNRNWKGGIDAMLLLALTGKDLSKPKLITPAQAIKAGVSEDVIAPLTERITTGVKLARVDANKKAQRIFKKE